MGFAKTKRRNNISDSLLDDCLVAFIERDILEDMDEDDVVIRLSWPLESIRLIGLKKSVVLLLVCCFKLSGI